MAPPRERIYHGFICYFSVCSPYTGWNAEIVAVIDICI